MNYTIRIKRQENPQASPCWQEFSFEGSADTSIASVLNELNHRSPLCEKSGTVVSPIAWECGCMIRKCGACAMRINGLPRLACSVFLRDCKGSVVTLEPLSKFPLVKDLVVDRSVIFEALKRTKLWLEGDAFQTSYTHSQRYRSAKCLLCGCCLEVCPNFDPNSEFAGAVLPVNAGRREWPFPPGRRDTDSHRPSAYSTPPCPGLPPGRTPAPQWPSEGLCLPWISKYLRHGPR